MQEAFPILCRSLISFLGSQLKTTGSSILNQWAGTLADSLPTHRATSATSLARSRGGGKRRLLRRWRDRETGPLFPAPTGPSTWEILCWVGPTFNTGREVLEEEHTEPSPSTSHKDRCSEESDDCSKKPKKNRLKISWVW